MYTLTAHEAQTNLHLLIKQAAESHHPITIIDNDNNAVLLSAQDWEAIQETLYLMAIPGMRESIKNGMAEPIAYCTKELEW